MAYLCKDNNVGTCTDRLKSLWENSRHLFTWLFDYTYQNENKPFINEESVCLWLTLMDIWKILC